MMTKKTLLSFLLLTVFVLNTVAQKITSPKEFFGFNIGDNYRLANYSQTEKYFQLVTKQSERALITEIGKTEEGRTQYMMIVSSPENLKHLEAYRQISQKLARAEISASEAAALAQKGKAVVWIDGGLHATETVGSQQLIQLYYELLTRNDAEMKHILDHVIILLSEVNPDGQELVANWYMQEKDSSKRNMLIPRVYNKYIGHDNNRDFYMMNMKETQNITRQHYLEWMPQIIYNHHQSGPAGSVIAGPPYRAPFNYDYDPLLMTQIDGVAASMINRLNVENKPGYTRLEGSSFNGWWDGGLRTAPYYHNMIGLLTEIIGNPTPSAIPLVPKRLLPDNATPFPVMPQAWTFQKSIDYSMSLNYGVLDYAARMKDKLLYNIYQMGRNSIKKGSEDTWTVQSYKIDTLLAAYERDRKSGRAKDNVSGWGERSLPVSYFDQYIKAKELRDPRGYIIPADQPDFPTAVRFINALLQSGLKVFRSTGAFSVAGKSYPEGSYIVKTNQAFRPHVLDMFEPQNYPNDFQYPGGPPIRPYDVTGWTLAFQMGIQFDRIMEDFSGPFEQVPYGNLQTPPASVIPASGDGFLLSAAVNNSFILVNDLLKAGVDVFRVKDAIQGLPAGSFYIPAKGFAVLKTGNTALGVPIMAASAVPGNKEKINKARIALFDYYGGSIPSGWTRWLLEQFHYSFTVIYPQDIDAGNLKDKYDVILFMNDGLPAADTTAATRRRTGPKPDRVPQEYQKMLGSFTLEKSLPQVKAFLEKGGKIITTGNNTALAYHLKLPVTNALVKTNKGGKTVSLKGDEYYIPTSILEVNINTGSPANYGLPSTTDIVFNNSPVFKLGAPADDIEVIASFDAAKDALRSGWAWGQSYLKGGIAAFKATVNKGVFYAFGPEITFRGQAHGTFKMLFNELYQ
ncbi:M14 family metallopeptidase [Niabella ginsenosidivorans]|nr:M14 metallopeptidase family protein [Niabella ginsenosidivorans]